jgi:hypothetical protein
MRPGRAVRDMSIELGRIAVATGIVNLWKDAGADHVAVQVLNPIRCRPFGP